MATREYHNVVPFHGGPFTDHMTVMVDGRKQANCLKILAHSDGYSVLVCLTPGMADSLAKSLIVAANILRENRRG